MFLPSFWLTDWFYIHTDQCVAVQSGTHCWRQPVRDIRMDMIKADLNGMKARGRLQGVLGASGHDSTSDWESDRNDLRWWETGRKYTADCRAESYRGNVYEVFIRWLQWPSVVSDMKKKLRDTGGMIKKKQLLWFFGASNQALHHLLDSILGLALDSVKCSPRSSSSSCILALWR